MYQRSLRRGCQVVHSTVFGAAVPDGHDHARAVGLPLDLLYLRLVALGEREREDPVVVVGVVGEPQPRA